MWWPPVAWVGYWVFWGMPTDQCPPDPASGRETSPPGGGVGCCSRRGETGQCGRPGCTPPEKGGSMREDGETTEEGPNEGRSVCMSPVRRCCCCCPCPGQSQQGGGQRGFMVVGIGEARPTTKRRPERGGGNGDRRVVISRPAPGRSTTGGESDSRQAGFLSLGLSVNPRKPGPGVGVGEEGRMGPLRGAKPPHRPQTPRTRPAGASRPQRIQQTRYRVEPAGWRILGHSVPHTTARALGRGRAVVHLPPNLLPVQPAG